jgi:sugar phosphate isomerase/epimerase
VFHAHAKDTELFGGRLYDYGALQMAVDAPKIAFVGTYWRYTIPGHGCARWGRLLKVLADSGYSGKISIELEDCNFNGSEEGAALEIRNGFIRYRRSNKLEPLQKGFLD